ncbi:MAG: hypothetical protein R3B46_07340 [Phycisphaerales bacterium]
MRSCHNNPVGGSGLDLRDAASAFRRRIGFDPLDAFGGSLLQANAIDEGCLEVVPMFANVTSPRNHPRCSVPGLSKAIEDADILFRANNPPAGTSRSGI